MTLVPTDTVCSMLMSLFRQERLPNHKLRIVLVAFKIMREASQLLIVVVHSCRRPRTSLNRFMQRDADVLVVSEQMMQMIIIYLFGSQKAV